MSFTKNVDACVQCANKISDQNISYNNASIQNDGIKDQNYKQIDYILKERVLTGSSFDNENLNTQTINLEDHQITRYIDSDGNESYSPPIKLKSYTEKIATNIDKEIRIENHLNYKRFNENEKDKCFDYYEYLTISRYFDMNENKIIENIVDFDAFTNNKNIKIEEESKIEIKTVREEVLKYIKSSRRPFLGIIGPRCSRAAHDYYLIKKTFYTYKRKKLTDKVNNTVQFGDWVLYEKKTEKTKE